MCFISWFIQPYLAWLNLPKDDRRYGYKQKFLKELLCPTQHSNLIPLMFSTFSIYIIPFSIHPNAFPIDVWIQCCPQKLLKDGHNKRQFVPINDAQFSITFTSSFWRVHKVLSIMPLFIWSWVLTTNVWNTICLGVLPSSLYQLPKSTLPNCEVHVSISPFGNFCLIDFHSL